MGVSKRLLRSAHGNVAITFAIAVVPILLGTGAAVDMIRVNNAKSVLQAAADAAALAGGASNKTTDAEIIEIAAQYLEANGASTVVETLDVEDLVNDTANGKFSVTLQGKVKTTFLALAGIDMVDIGANSEVARGSSGPLELVLALDTTYSMSENNKIGTLKTAATNLVNSIMTSSSVKVGVVPFADYQQLGMVYSGKSWLNVPPPDVGSYPSCTTTYPDKSGCTVETTCYSDGVPYSCSNETCTHWGDPEYSNCTTVNYSYEFDGCVQARPQAYHDSISDPNSPQYPGVRWRCNVDLRELTSVKADVISTINSMWTTGNTYIPSGLIWGWNMLTPEEPLTAAESQAAIVAKGGQKVLVLMTDGVNTVASHDPTGYFSNPEDFGYGAGPGYANGITTSLCQKIKDSGVVVYSVLFDVDDAATESMLRDCATEPAKSFVADDASELVAAFANIGVSLSQLRLVK